VALHLERACGESLAFTPGGRAAVSVGAWRHVFGNEAPEKWERQKKARAEARAFV
jgi:hypothetical protein